MSQKLLSRPVLQSARALALLVALGLLVAWGYSLWKETPKPSPGEPVTVLWTFEPPERGAIISTPLVTADGGVYVAAIHDVGLATFGAVYYLDPGTHKVVWKFDDDGAMQHMYSTPCLADGRLYIGEGMHANNVCKFYCLDAATGKKLWHFVTSGHIESSPCVADGNVYFGAGDDGVYCLDAVSGAERWHYHEGVHVDSNPIIIRKRLYAGSGVSRTHKTPSVFCLDSESGKVIWKTPTDLPAWASPAVQGDDVVIGLGNGRLMKSADPPERPAGALLVLDAQTGKPRWQHPVGDGVLVKPALDAAHVYFGSRDGYCYCLGRANHDVVWRVGLGSAIVTSPGLHGGRLYVAGSEGLMSCLDAASGETRWSLDLAARTQTKPQMFSSPVVVPEANGDHRRIYFGTELKGATSNAAVLYCLRD